MCLFLLLPVNKHQKTWCTSRDSSSSDSPEKWWLEDDPFLLKWPFFKGHSLVLGGVTIWTPTIPKTEKDRLHQTSFFKTQPHSLKLTLRLWKLAITKKDMSIHFIFQPLIFQWLLLWVLELLYHNTLHRTRGLLNSCHAAAPRHVVQEPPRNNLG